MAKSHLLTKAMAGEATLGADVKRLGRAGRELHAGSTGAPTAPCPRGVARWDGRGWGSGAPCRPCGMRIGLARASHVGGTCGCGIGALGTTSDPLWQVSEVGDAQPRRVFFCDRGSAPPGGGDNVEIASQRSAAYQASTERKGDLCRMRQVQVMLHPDFLNNCATQLQPKTGGAPVLEGGLVAYDGLTVLLPMVHLGGGKVTWWVPWCGKTMPFGQLRLHIAFDLHTSDSQARCCADFGRVR